MANTFSNLVANAYKKLDVISREMVGFVNSVTLDADASAVPVGQTLYSFVAPASTASTITPGVTVPDDGDQTIGSKTLTITSQRRVPFRWTGEEGAALNRGAGADAVKSMQLEQAMRTIVNEMEADVYATVRKGASRAFGLAGTAPFASVLQTANLRKILDDNGADGARSLIIDSNAGVNLRLLSNLFKVNEAGTSMTLRDGELMNLHGFSIKESGGISAVTAGTGTNYVVNNVSGYAIGATSIAVDVGSGTILAGDIITFAGDTNKYVVTTGIAAPGTLVIAAPGLRVAHADEDAVSVGAAFTANCAFSQTAVVLGARTPYVPEGELAVNSEIIQDPRSGISFRLAQYGEYMRAHYEIQACWGSTVFKPEHTAILLG